MQNTSTGEMHMLGTLEAFRTAVPNIPFQSAVEEMQAAQEALQAAKDKAVPNRDHQGPVFTIGEVLEIRGGKFRVNGITRKRIYLDSIPS
jgi:hypothetical protein